VALALTKQALEQAWAASFEEQLETEAVLQGRAGATADHAEGLAAFIERRPPRFTGR
jgi:2-(1,2-epoxy-1,2-dihydrophenyl)acetyl-CoA isomerase